MPRSLKSSRRTPRWSPSTWICTWQPWQSRQRQPSTSRISSTRNLTHLTPSSRRPLGISPSSRAPARTALWPRLRAAWDPPPPPAPNLPNGARPACRRGRVSDRPATLAVSSVPNQAVPPAASPTHQTADTPSESAPAPPLPPPAAHAAASCTSESTPRSACSARLLDRR